MAPESLTDLLINQKIGDGLLPAGISSAHSILNKLREERENDKEICAIHKRDV